MIDGYNPPVPNGHLLMKIAAVISDASLTKKVDENGGRITFTNSDREDDCIVDEKMWEPELTTALKAYNKFIDNGEAIFFAIKGQTEPKEWNKMCRSGICCHSR